MAQRHAKHHGVEAIHHLRIVPHVDVDEKWLHGEGGMVHDTQGGLLPLHVNIFQLAIPCRRCRSSHRILVDPMKDHLPCVKYNPHGGLRRVSDASDLDGRLGDIESLLAMHPHHGVGDVGAMSFGDCDGFLSLGPKAILLSHPHTEDLRMIKCLQRELVSNYFGTLDRLPHGASLGNFLDRKASTPPILCIGPVMLFNPHPRAMKLVQRIGIHWDLEDVYAKQIALVHLAQGDRHPSELFLHQSLKPLAILGPTNTRRPSIHADVKTVLGPTRTTLNRLDAQFGIPLGVALNTIGVVEPLESLALGGDVEGCHDVVSIHIFTSVKVHSDTRPQCSSIISFLKLKLELTLHVVQDTSPDLLSTRLFVVLASSLAKLAILFELTILNHLEGQSSREDSFSELIVDLAASITIANVAQSFLLLDDALGSSQLLQTLLLRLGLLLFRTLLVVDRQLAEDFIRAFGARANALVVRVKVSGEAAMRT